MSTLKNAALFFWKLLVGSFLCQFSIASILVVGWTYRLMQRSAVRRWISQSGDASAYEKQFHAFRKWPNWIVQQNALKSIRDGMRIQEGVWSRVKILGQGAVDSVLRNAVIGLQAMLNTWVLTFLPTLFWVFGWYSGWDNSFNKGYEQFFTGIALSFIGIGLFIVAMLYVPMAQARQAVTGEWRSFYDYRLIRVLLRRHRFASLLLAVGYSAISVPVIVLKAIPSFFPKIVPRMLEMGSIELFEFLNQYYFRASVVGFFCFVVLRILTARLYATALASAVKDTAISVDELSTFERETLETLGLATPVPAMPISLPARVVSGTAARAWRGAVIAATVTVWFTFVAQIYISEFVNYHPKRGWLNQPLIQLPWFRYVPKHVEQAAREERTKTEMSEGHAFVVGASFASTPEKSFVLDPR